MYHQPNTSKTDCPPYHNIYVLILLCKNYTDILKYDTTRNFIQLVNFKCISRFCEETQYEIHTLFLLCLELKFYVCIINCIIIRFVKKKVFKHKHMFVTKSLSMKLELFIRLFRNNFADSH